MVIDTCIMLCVVSACSNITFANIAATDSKVAGQFDCVGDSPCYGISVRNVTHSGTAPNPWLCANAHGVVAGPVTPALTCLQA